LLFGCDASVRAGIGRLELRPAPERLVLRRTDGRADFIVAVRGRETRDFGLAVEDFGLAEVAFAVLRLAVVDLAWTVVRLAAVRGLAVLVERAVVRFAAVRGLLTRGLAEADFGFVVEDFGFAVVDRLTVALRAVVDARRAVEARRAVDEALRVPEAARLTVVPAAGLADCMALAAAVRALAAVTMDLVAVFMDRMADDIVFADEVAFVAAAVILVAADVTLVAADETFFAATIGVAELRAAGRRVERDAVLRVERAAVVRVERAAVLRVDRDAGLRVVDEAVPAFLVAMERVLFGLLLMVPVFDFGRAVPDALRLTDLLRAVLAELRRLAARVVVLTGTEISPRLDQLRWCYSTGGANLHTQRLFPEDDPPQDPANRPAD
jgi:hypothetical protein